jgi:hypothetical protein
MSNTIVYGKNIDISSIDSDWTWNQTGSPYAAEKEGIRVRHIIFMPGAIADKLVIKDGGSTGPSLFPPDPVSLSDSQAIDYGGEMLKPFIDYSESTLSSGSRVIIMLKS